MADLLWKTNVFFAEALSLVKTNRIEKQINKKKDNKFYVLSAKKVKKGD